MISTGVMLIPFLLILFLKFVLMVIMEKKLIMVGSAGTLSTIPLLRLLVEKVAEHSGQLDLTMLHWLRRIHLGHRSVLNSMPRRIFNLCIDDRCCVV